MSTSSSGGLIAFGDASGIIYLLSLSPNAVINVASEPVSIASPFFVPLPPVEENTYALVFFNCFIQNFA